MHWLVAMQAQDYAGAKWAIGTRLPGSTDAGIEAAFNRGAILRTHLLRPTWHFVASQDIRWLLALTAPRVHAANGHMYRRLALDAATFARSRRAMVKALRGRFLTRDALRSVLERHGIATDLERMAYLLMHEELEGVICSGPRQGKQFTYALLDEHVPPSKALSHDEAVAQLALRFFRSRWPATAQDLAKWSDLPVADARLGWEAARPQLAHVTNARAPRARRSPAVHLLSVYDEYFSSYRERCAVMSGLYVITIDGMVVGRWHRVPHVDSGVELTLFRRVTADERRALDAAVRRYAAFLQRR